MLYWKLIALIPKSNLVKKHSSGNDWITVPALLDLNKTSKEDYDSGMEKIKKRPQGRLNMTNRESTAITMVTAFVTIRKRGNAKKSWMPLEANFNDM